MPDHGFSLPDGGSPFRSQKPFGPPDGGRADLDTLSHYFVPFGPGEASSGLGMDGRDRSVRVIVGRKGAGKTLYLRRLQAYATQDHSLYVDDFQQSVPRTGDVVRVCNWYPGSLNAEKWMAIWKAAILRSLVSHVLCSDRLALDGPGHELDLRTRYGRLYRDFDVPHSIYSQLSEIIRDHHNGRSLDNYIYDPLWESLEYRLGEVLKALAPICFYVDAVDEEFRHAPRYWLMCQKGLFYQVMRFLTDGRLGGRLHIVICIRDHVYSATQQTEHATKYIETQYIRVLDWDHPSIQYFLRHKLASLAPDWMADASEPTVAGWLGAKTIYNEVRDIWEDAESYLLRHTRLIPRDVVVVGNLLSEKVAAARARGESRLDDDTIRKVVRAAARKFGDEQIAICANQIASELMPLHAAALGYDNIYTGEDSEHYEGGGAYLDALQQDLRTMLEAVQVDRFGPARLRALQQRADEKFEGACDVLSVLWQSGLLGYTDGPVKTGAPVFYQATAEDDLKLPQRKAGYVFHPILIDSLDRLRGIGAPVAPAA